jgi:hypothetical protein
MCIGASEGVEPCFSYVVMTPVLTTYWFNPTNTDSVYSILAPN